MIVYYNNVCIPSQDPDDYDPDAEPEGGDELASDSFPCQLLPTVEDGVVYKFTLRQRKDKDGDFDTGANESKEEAAEALEAGEVSGIDIVLNHNLKPATMQKASHFKAYIKKHGVEMKKLMAKKYSEQEVKDRLGKLSKIYLTLLADFDNLEFFSGEHYNHAGTLLIVQWDNDTNTPYGFLAVDGVREEKQ